MSEEFIVGDGDAAKLVPVELKDHSKDPVIAELKKEAPVIEKKKRGRPKKVAEKPLREFYCSTCREVISELNVMKIGCGPNRAALFCPQCQRSLGFFQPDLDEKVADLIKNNPTGK